MQTTITDNLKLLVSVTLLNVEMTDRIERKIERSVTIRFVQGAVCSQPDSISGDQMALLVDHLTSWVQISV
jgi:hypothetical protein